MSRVVGDSLDGSLDDDGDGGSVIVDVVVIFNVLAVIPICSSRYRYMLFVIEKLCYINLITTTITIFIISTYKQYKTNVEVNLAI